MKTIGHVKEIAGQCPLSFELDGEGGVLFHIDDSWYAVRNRCPHQQFEKLHEGEVNGTVVTCPMHGWKFDLKTGNNVAGGGRLKTWVVKVRNGEILVGTDSEE